MGARASAVKRRWRGGKARRGSLDIVVARKRAIDNQLELDITFEREERNLFVERWRGWENYSDR